jgi:hypothetical protein
MNHSINLFKLNPPDDRNKKIKNHKKAHKLKKRKFFDEFEDGNENNNK